MKSVQIVARRCTQMAQEIGVLIVHLTIMMEVDIPFRARYISIASN